MLFDAIIGNTDGHHENWGIIVKDTKKHFSPIYDNGETWL